jgi:hypothetical protein
MTRLTAGSSSLQLYRYLRAYVPDNIFASVVQQIFTPADTVIGNVDYYFEFYIHFPDEHPLMVWNLTTQPGNNALKEKLIATFKGCATLAPTVTSLQQMKRSAYFIQVLARPDSVIKTTGMAAVLERLQKFDSCYKPGNK